MCVLLRTILNRSGGRIGQKETLNSNLVTTRALSDPIGSSGGGAVLQRFPRLSLVFGSQADLGKKANIWAEQFPSAKDNLQRGTLL